MAVSEIWVRRREGLEEIGLARPQDAGYVVTWAGGPPVTVPRRPSGVRWAPEGTLKAQAFADEGAVRAQLAKSPDAVVRQLLREEGVVMDAQTIAQRLVELNVSKGDANKAIKKVEPGLRQDPHIVYGPDGEVERFAWSDTPVPVDQDAFFRGGRWPQVLEQVAGGITPRQRDLLRERALEDPQVTDLTRVALAAAGVLPWPDADVIQRLTRRSGAGTALKGLSDNVLGQIRAAATEQARVDVLLFLVRAETTSKALTGLAGDIDNLQPAAELLDETLRALRNDLSSRRTTGAQRAALLRRLPVLRGGRQTTAALALSAYLSEEREFKALIECLDAEVLLSLPDPVWADAVGGLRKAAREHLASATKSEALRTRLLETASSS